MVDGDKLLVCSDEILIKVAERCLKEFGGIVPLYYDMKKAEGQFITPENLYNGLNAAFVGGNIGVISNDITKVWNSSVWVEGSEEEKLEALKTIKLLCMDNNFCIDHAKTLYKPTPTEEAEGLYRKYVRNSKVPRFFIYAKGKSEENVEPNNNTLVNRLEDMIKDKRLVYKVKDFGRIDYTLMVSNPDIEVDENVIQKYIELGREYRFKVNIEDEKDNYSYIRQLIIEQLKEFGYSETELSDMLVKYGFSVNKRAKKEALWLCFGDNIYENLKRNIGNKSTVCPKCGKRFEKISPNMVYCENCKNKTPKVHKCIDCGKDLGSSHSCRCEECKKNAQREMARLRMAKLRKGKTKK